MAFIKYYKKGKTILSDPEDRPRFDPYVNKLKSKGITPLGNSLLIERLTPILPPPLPPITFGQLFALARKLALKGGPKTFMWTDKQGKTYEVGTNLLGEPAVITSSVDNLVVPVILKSSTGNLTVPDTIKRLEQTTTPKSELHKLSTTGQSTNTKSLKSKLHTGNLSTLRSYPLGIPSNNSMMPYAVLGTMGLVGLAGGYGLYKLNQTLKAREATLALDQRLNAMRKNYKPMEYNPPVKNTQSTVNYIDARTEMQNRPGPYIKKTPSTSMTYYNKTNTNPNLGENIWQQTAQLKSEVSKASGDIKHQMKMNAQRNAPKPESPKPFKPGTPRVIEESPLVPRPAVKESFVGRRNVPTNTANRNYNSAVKGFNKGFSKGIMRSNALAIPLQILIELGIQKEAYDNLVLQYGIAGANEYIRKAQKTTNEINKHHYSDETKLAMGSTAGFFNKGGLITYKS